MKQIVLVVLLFGAPVAVTPGSSSAPADLDTRPATQPARAFTLDLTGQLAGPPAEAAGHQARLQSLGRVLDEAHGPLDRAAAHLAIANWLLAVPTARPATRWLIGLETAADLRAMAASAHAARDHLDRARALLPAHEDVSNHDDQKRRSQLSQAADTLEPFDCLFAAAGAPADPEANRSTYGQVALGLAAVREADDATMAACALLWQSFGWERAGRHERALISLPDALTRPEHPPYDLLSRLLRCRIVADAGQPAAATTLTVRMRALCPHWFPRASADEVKARRLLIALLQGRIGRDWLEQLRASGSRAAAARLETLLTRLQETLFPDDQRRAVYHLPSAVPIIVEPPAVERPMPSSAPATATAAASGPARADGDQNSHPSSTPSSSSF